ncbi:hypothetical protein BJ878DRAFT_166691 [Calycina marina]|uniref:DUF8004 domain-containing protein n=1 Tax=Calycina marina TaxID=1763456 RepID=A0A9P7Z9F8_9HELO|nr:hypothetical protein BJ878DRAFT_166691 [Calycina marina]
MSGRSAVVRRKKEEEGKKQSIATGEEVEVPRNFPLLSDFPMPGASQSELFYPVESMSSGSDKHSYVDSMKHYGHGSYQQVSKPVVPVIINSQIEKSNLRVILDNKSTDVRKGLTNIFKSKKKKVQEARPGTSRTTRPDLSREISYELDGKIMPTPGYGNKSEDTRLGPPQTKLPPLPTQQHYREWLGKGLAAQAWNYKKLRQDPGLWDEFGDVLIYIQHNFSNGGPEDITAAFRVQSHVIQNSYMNYLRSAMTFSKNPRSVMPPSPIGSQPNRRQYPLRGGASSETYTPPASEYGGEQYDQVASYEIFIPLPSEYRNRSEAEIVHFNVTTRNALAVLFRASLVGKDLSKALIETQRRLEQWLGEEGVSAAELIAEYLHYRELDDMRNNPAIAIAMMAWSEASGVRWNDIYRESFVHLAGMYGRTQLFPEFKTLVSRTTRELLDNANYNMQLRVKKAEDRLKDLDFTDLWPVSSGSFASYGAFERLRSFFLSEFATVHGSWPPSIPVGEDYWLTREVAQTLRKDFGALYDYLVDREVEWDCVEEQPGPKWSLKRGDKTVDGNTQDCPMTTLFLNWDKKEGLEHIPAPYPLLPDSIPVKQSGRENLFKVNSSKKPAPPKDDRMAQRRFALAYTQSTNIFKLDPDAPPNAWIDAYLDYEKTDQATTIDPRDARRGRWVLIYGILQILSGISVDTPRMNYPQVGFCYHISPSLVGVPPWDRTKEPMYQATHLMSHCWEARQSWMLGEPVQDIPCPMRLPSGGVPSRKPSTSILEYDESAYGGQTSNTAPQLQPKSPRHTMRSQVSTRTSGRSNRLSDRDRDAHENQDYSPSMELVNEWPIAEETRLDMASRLENHQQYHRRDNPSSIKAHRQIQRNLSQLSDDSSVSTRHDGGTNRMQDRSPQPSELSMRSGSRYEHGGLSSRSGSRPDGAHTPVRGDAQTNAKAQKLEIKNPRHHGRRVPPYTPSGMSTSFSPLDPDAKSFWIDFDDVALHDGKLLYTHE